MKDVAEPQIVQDDYDRFRVRLLPGKGYRDAEGRQVAANLAKRLRRVDICLQVVDKIERTAAGKFRPLVCNLPARRPYLARRHQRRISRSDVSASAVGGDVSRENRDHS